MAGSVGTYVRSGIKWRKRISNKKYSWRRITLKSTIDLVMYLLKECDFKYVLTSKLNQDSLEVSYLNY